MASYQPMTVADLAVHLSQTTDEKTRWKTRWVRSRSVPITRQYAGVTGKYIAYVGRLSPEKGWDLLVDIAERNPGLRIEVAGFVSDQAWASPMPWARC